MPTALRIGSYRFYFYSYDCGEPRHMHVDRESMSAKIWLDPVVSLAEITVTIEENYVRLNGLQRRIWIH
jgi:hypothetical protein